MTTLTDVVDCPVKWQNKISKFCLVSVSNVRNWEIDQLLRLIFLLPTLTESRYPVFRSIFTPVLPFVHCRHSSSRRRDDASYNRHSNRYDLFDNLSFPLIFSHRGCHVGWPEQILCVYFTTWPPFNLWYTGVWTWLSVLPLHRITSNRHVLAQGSRTKDYG